MDDLVLLLLLPPVVVAGKVGIMAAAVGASCTRVARVFFGSAANTPLAAPLSTRKRNSPSMAFAPAAGKLILQPSSSAGPATAKAVEL